ncbi:MAG: thiol:disulfide interchange protein DsbA/DsbL [Xanthomonadaceae bacterium]|nr:thiol:disulfide interchange protein DsbA/DsbL [Xanthomonadaceae bacterium]
MRAFRMMFALIALALPVSLLAQALPEPRLDVDYSVIEPAQPMSAKPGRIEVVEVFGYSCIHCARFEPLVQKWKKDLPEDVDFVYVPMSNGGAWETFGRAFYAAESLGLLDKAHEALFNAVHIEKTITSLDQVPAFYEQFGVDEETFKSTMQSTGVNIKIARAKQVVPRWRVEGTPTMVINGKYRVMATDRGLPGMLDTANWLIDRERSALAAN